MGVAQALQTPPAPSMHRLRPWTSHPSALHVGEGQGPSRTQPNPREKPGADWPRRSCLAGADGTESTPRGLDTHLVRVHRARVCAARRSDQEAAMLEGGVWGSRENSGRGGAGIGQEICARRGCNLAGCGREKLGWGETAGKGAGGAAVVCVAPQPLCTLVPSFLSPCKVSGSFRKGGAALAGR